MTEQGADAELAARLDVALHERLSESSVDVAALAAGSRRRSRRVRSQRLGAAVGALAVLVAVPVGWQLATAEQSTDSVSAVLLPKHEQRAAAEVPESLGFSASELPPGVSLTGAAAGASSGSVDPELVDGLSCAGPTGTAQPGVTDNAQQREWRWSGDTEVSLTVTRWPSTDAAADALTGLTTGIGGCSWNQPVEVLPHEVTGSEQTWAGSSTADGRAVVRMLVRVNELVAGVQVAGSDEETAAELADSLATIEVEKLTALD
ncbi:hypothetical protein LWF15_03060 [Kineosporia rhizophila]|uniref:hypothetical protein n=1 Tax=Kineosporia TaxID=49184 RepID=UPI001E5AB652|nr:MULTISPECIES: hypothetical protein [Kineosporia]MCE0534478.1 hypothetical protein [Kineosporia rhizophila]GLY14013.1 hypothetical protein Kisp01_10290 [Kineosporia sp. NBRC 101677]